MLRKAFPTVVPLSQERPAFLDSFSLSLTLTQLSSAQLNSAQLNSLNSAQLSSAQLTHSLKILRGPIVYSQVRSVEFFSPGAEALGSAVQPKLVSLTEKGAMLEAACAQAASARGAAEVGVFLTRNSPPPPQ